MLYQQAILLQPKIFYHLQRNLKPHSHISITLSTVSVSIIISSISTRFPDHLVAGARLNIVLFTPDFLPKFWDKYSQRRLEFIRYSLSKQLYLEKMGTSLK